MISFKGVTPAPTAPSEPPTQAQRMVTEAPAPQAEAPQMKKQLEEDTVEFTNK